MADEILGSSSELSSEAGSEAISSSSGESSTSSTRGRRPRSVNGPNDAALMSVDDLRDIPPR